VEGRVDDRQTGILEECYRTSKTSKLTVICDLGTMVHVAPEVAVCELLQSIESFCCSSVTPTPK